MKVAVVSHPRTEERMHPVVDFVGVLSRFSEVHLIQVDMENASASKVCPCYNLKSPIRKSSNLILRLVRFLVNVLLMNIAVYRIGSSNKIDVFITFGSKIYSGSASFFGAKLARSVLIIRDSGTSSCSNSFGGKILRLIERLISSLSDGIIGLSRRETKGAVTFSKTARMLSIPQSVNPELFGCRKLEAPEHLKNLLSKDDFVFIFVGRLEEDKGIYELISAFRGLKEKKSKLLLVGDGPCRKHIEGFLSRTNNSRIILVGRVPHKLIPKYYCVADALVLPSLNEGVPNVVLEALAMELPVVASDVGGVSEFVINYQTGFLSRRGDIVDLRRQMKRLLELDQKERLAMGARGRRIVTERCCPEKVATELKDFLGSL